LKWILTAVALLLAASTAQAQDGVQEIVYEALIDQTGEYLLMDGSLKISVFEADGMIQFQVKGFGPEQSAAAGKSFGPSQAVIEMASNWFIFPISDTDIWVYLGDGSVLHYRWFSEENKTAERIEDPERIEAEAPVFVHERILMVDAENLRK
jgi:hypothetical protein